MDRASVLFYQATPESLKKCIEYSQAAIALDPTYVSPYGEIASAYSLLSLTDVLPSREAHQKVVEWSNKAIAINDSVYISRIALLGEQATYEWDWTGIAKVGRLHPFYANLLKATGRVTELAALTARDADKLTEVIPSYYAAEAFYYNRQYAEAIDQYKRTLELSPSFLPAQFGLGRAYTQANKSDEAIEQTRKAMPLRRTAGWLGYALARFGRRSEASRVLDELKRRAHTEYVSPLNLAWIYIGLADWEQAFTWMQRACDQRVPRLLELRSEPLYDPLRLDPRYRDLIHCVGVDVER
jgi:tetratricopeptide (TPR) repeat protein